MMPSADDFTRRFLDAESFARGPGCAGSSKQAPSTAEGNSAAAANRSFERTKAASGTSTVRRLSVQNVPTVASLSQSRPSVHGTSSSTRDLFATNEPLPNPVWVPREVTGGGGVPTAPGGGHAPWRAGTVG